MKKRDAIVKRVFDICFSFFGLVLLFIPITFFIIISTIDTGRSGLFIQKRIGQFGELFNIYKLRTMRETPSNERIVSSIGCFFRRTKLDELPQLFNVLKGDMSFVGPRPDIEGFANQLSLEDRIILEVRPGITGLATLHFKNEESILAKKNNPHEYNRNVIWPKKVELNKIYIKEYSFYNDLKILFRTIFIL